MEEIIHLRTNNRDDFIFLKKLQKPNGKESKTFLLKTNARSVKYEYIDTKRKTLVPSGCLSIMIEEQLLEEADAIISNISYTPGLGYTITFK
jgi:hypothetical protein